MKTLLLWLLAVLILSVMPTPASSVDIPSADKLLHVAIYAITSALFFVVLRERRPRASIGTLTLGAIALSFGYGLLMEAAQTLFPPREPSLWDAAANLAGAIAGGLYIRRKAWKRKGKGG